MASKKVQQWLVCLMGLTSRIVLVTRGVPVPGNTDGQVLKQIFVDSHELARKEVCYQDSERSRIRARVSKIRKESKV